MLVWVWYVYYTQAVKKFYTRNKPTNTNMKRRGDSMSSNSFMSEHNQRHTSDIGSYGMDKSTSVLNENYISKIKWKM